MTLPEINLELNILYLQIESIDKSWDYKEESLVNYWFLIEPVKNKISELEDLRKMKSRVR